MSEPDFSFDPSTWLKGEKDGAPAESAPETTGPPKDSAAVSDAPTENVAPSDSFDPSTWASASKAPAAPVEDPPAADPPTAALAKPAPSSRRGLLIGGAAAGLVLVGGGGAALLLRRSAAKSADAADPTAAAAPPPSTAASTEHQVLTLPDMASLPTALASYGLDRDASAKIAAAAVAAMPKSGSSDTLRTELVLNRVGPKPTLLSLAISRPDGSGAKVIAGANGFVASQLSVNVRQEVKVVRGQVDSESFYSSAVTAGLSDRIIPDFFQAFVYDFDFQREIEPGAAFEAAIAGDVTIRVPPWARASCSTPG